MQVFLVSEMCYNYMTYISNSAHYKEVLSRVQSVKHTLWIGTADIKYMLRWAKKNNLF